jgi:hypothetical protein
MKPKSRLKLTRLILSLWQPKTRRVFFSFQGGTGFILSDKKVLKMTEEELQYFISRKYQSKTNREENKKINRKFNKISVTQSTQGIIDFIAPVGKCRGEPKRLKKCWR